MVLICSPCVQCSFLYIVNEGDRSVPDFGYLGRSQKLSIFRRFNGLLMCCFYYSNDFAINQYVCAAVHQLMYNFQSVVFIHLHIYTEHQSVLFVQTEVKCLAQHR